MKYFIISAFGRDQLGIVSETTAALAELNCSIEDSSMTRLKNEFAMLLIIHSDRELTEDQIKQKLETVIKNKELKINIKYLDAEQWRSRRPEQVHASLNVYGADQIGIVAKTTNLLAQYQINISDLYTSLTPENLFIMHFDLELPAEFQKEEFIQDLDQLKNTLEVDASFEIIEHIDL